MVETQVRKLHKMSNDINATKYYNDPHWWGGDVDVSNRERIERTLMMIPADVTKVLDLGCGDGQVSNHLISKGIKTVGVDISSTALPFFQGEKAIASADNLPFEEKSFDLVLSSEVLEHLPAHIYEASLKEIERVAKKYILISTPHDEYLPVGYSKCENCQHVFHANLHIRSFNQEIHTTLFAKFKAIKSEKVGFWQHYHTLTNLMHFFGSYRLKNGAICPQCGKAQTGKKTRFRWLVNKGFNFISRILPKHRKGKWIISLYQS